MRTRLSSTSLALSTIVVLSCGLCGGAYKIGNGSRGRAMTTPPKSIGLREVIPRMRGDMLEVRRCPHRVNVLACRCSLCFSPTPEYSSFFFWFETRRVTLNGNFS